MVTKWVLGWLSEATATFVTTAPEELTQAERDLERAEEALAKFKANTQAIVTLGNEWNRWLEDYLAARDLAQTTVDALRDDSNPNTERIPELWDEWTPQSRREFLGHMLEVVTVEPAKGSKAPLSDRLKVKLNRPGDIYLEWRESTEDFGAVDYGTLEAIRERLASR